MKKLIMLIIAVFIAAGANSQILTKQIASAAKGVDSLVGGAPAGGTTKYYYFNTTASATSGLVKSSVPITQYEVAAVQVTINAPHKAADISDSVQISLEVSYDNNNWVKWTNAGATTTATQTQYYNGGPKVTGSGVYTYAPDLVTMKATAGGAVFQPKGLVAPYLRVKLTAFKASSSTYPQIVVSLKKL